MKLGVYTAILHDRPLREALEVIASLGLTGAEINAGGFLPTPHLPVRELLSGEVTSTAVLVHLRRHRCVDRRVELQRQSAAPGPGGGSRGRRGSAQRDPGRRPSGCGPRGHDVRTSAGAPWRQVAAWHVNTWDSGYLDSLDYQWDEIAAPFWTEIDALAREHGVKVAIEMHPQNLVFNPPTLKRLVEKTGATHVGAEMDPSHLFWQGIDPVDAIEWLGPLVFHAAAKDTRINENCKIYGVLDDRFTRIPLDQNPTGLGGRHVVNKWPEDSAWDFVAVGRGHDTRVLGAVPQRLGGRRPQHVGEHRTRRRGVRAVGGPASRRRNAQDRQFSQRRLSGEGDNGHGCPPEDNAPHWAHPDSPARRGAIDPDRLFEHRR